MPLGYDRTIYIMAFDHRGSFQKLFGVTGAPTAEDNARIADGKTLIFEGLQQAIADGASIETSGVLTDEQYGADVARKAKAEGFPVAMPVEKTGQEEFDFEYGDAFGDHIEDFDPTFAKVLVRSNPDWDPEMNRRQFGRLKVLGDWLAQHGRRFLFELLVPATDAQLASVGGDANRYDTELRPGLMLRIIEEIQGFGIDPDIWKIEGLESRDTCVQVSELVRRGGRDAVGCVVLGRGADDAKVETWLRAGSGVPGYLGFAIGRSIFNQSVKGMVAGTMDRSAAAALISQKYLHFIDVYEGRA